VRNARRRCREERRRLHRLLRSDDTVALLGLTATSKTGVRAGSSCSPERSH
jgi:hypothetical protein